MVLLILSEGKKWGLYYQEPNNGGKKWEEMVEPVYSKMGERDCPPSKPQLTI